MKPKNELLKCSGIEKKFKKCCLNNLDKPKRKGRAWYVCSKCGKDISLMWFFYQLAIREETHD